MCMCGEEGASTVHGCCQRQLRGAGGGSWREKQRGGMGLQCGRLWDLRSWHAPQQMNGLG